MPQLNIIHLMLRRVYKGHVTKHTAVQRVQLVYIFIYMHACVRGDLFGCVQNIHVLQKL